MIHRYPGDQGRGKSRGNRGPEGPVKGQKKGLSQGLETNLNSIRGDTLDMDPGAIGYLVQSLSGKRDNGPKY